MKASEKRDYIIDKSYRLFLCRSYEGVSISEISKAIGFTKGALYHHFANKNDLFKAVIDKYLDLRVCVVEDMDVSVLGYIQQVIKHSESVIQQVFGDLPQQSSLNYFALYIDAFRHYPEFVKAKGNFIQQELGKLQQIIQNGIDKKEIRADVDVEILATNIFSLSVGMIMDLLHTRSSGSAVNTLNRQLMEYYKLIKL